MTPDHIALQPLRDAQRRQDPVVIGQLGQSLDGRIATPTGQSRYINGSAALDHLHRLRAAVQAVVVGVGTVIADDPRLTVRRVTGDDPTRVIIDPNGRLPRDRAWTCLSGDGPPTWIVMAEDAPAPPLAPDCVIRLPRGDEGLAPAQILSALRERGLDRVLVEGGANTLGRFIAAGCVDRLHLLVAPLILGSGPVGLALPPIDQLSEAKRPLTTLHPLPDGDVLFDCDLRRNRPGCDQAAQDQIAPDQTVGQTA